MMVAHKVRVPSSLGFCLGGGEIGCGGIHIGGSIDANFDQFVLYGPHAAADVQQVSSSMPSILMAVVSMRVVLSGPLAR